MDVATLKDWGTFLGAVIGAIAATATLWKQVTPPRDKIHVAAGTIQPTVWSHGEDLYIVNVGPHPVDVQDYGAILFNGKLMSYPIEFETHQLPSELSGYLVSKCRLEPRESTQAGLEIPGRVAGVYANTSTQKPQLRFYGSTKWHVRLRIWIKVRFRSEYV